MNHAYQKIKEELKTLGLKIRKQKLERKEMCRKYQDTWKIDMDIVHNKFEFRHKHIARCLLSGRSYEQIEQPRESRKPSWRSINEYKRQFIEKYEAYTAAQLSKAEAEILTVLGY